MRKVCRQIFNPRWGDYTPARYASCDKQYCDGAADEDLWHAFNLIREGDFVTATTYRKVSKDTGNATQTEKIKLRLTVEIEAVDYDSEGVHGLSRALPARAAVAIVGDGLSP